MDLLSIWSIPVILPCTLSWWVTSSYYILVLSQIPHEQVPCYMVTPWQLPPAPVQQLNNSWNISYIEISQRWNHTSRTCEITRLRHLAAENDGGDVQYPLRNTGAGLESSTPSAWYSTITGQPNHQTKWLKQIETIPPDLRFRWIFLAMIMSAQWNSRYIVQARLPNQTQFLNCCE